MRLTIDNHGGFELFPEEKFAQKEDVPEVDIRQWITNQRQAVGLMTHVLLQPVNDKDQLIVCVDTCGPGT